MSPEGVGTGRRSSFLVGLGSGGAVHGLAYSDGTATECLLN
jgi:hypothetical protein